MRAMSDHLFPDDILIQILSNLPLKSVGRFSLVSKKWHAIITSPHFISTHLTSIQKRTENPTLLLFRYYHESDGGDRFKLYCDKESEGFLSMNSIIKLQPNSRAEFSQIVGSCNGVVCLCDNLFGEFPTKPIMLWNPLIQKSATLPLPSIDPFANCFLLGFGCDLLRRDCKVVRIVYPDSRGWDKSAEVEVYSLSKRSWRRVTPIGLNCFIIDFAQSQTFLNGVVHWMACKKGNLQNTIMGFDCSVETFRDIVLPDALADELAMDLSAIVHGESLAMAQYGRVSCCIWEMKEYGIASSWMKLYSVPFGIPFVKVLGFRRNEEPLVTMTCDFTTGLMGSYQPEASLVKVQFRGILKSLCVLSYEETLAMLDFQTGFDSESTMVVVERPAPDSPIRKFSNFIGEVIHFPIRSLCNLVGILKNFPR